jgi:uncharacterized membrane protein (UPF0182 family)
MYVLLFTILFGGGAFLVHRATVKPNRSSSWLGLSLIGFGAILIILMAFWFEMLWFYAIGFSDRFWTFFLSRIGIGSGGAILAGTVGFLLAHGAGAHLRKTLALLAAAAGGIWGYLAWERCLMFIHQVDTLITDPFLGLDVSFYLFTLPFLDSLFWLFLFIATICLIAVLIFRERDGLIAVTSNFHVPHPRLLIPSASLMLAVVLAYGQLLGIFHLLYSDLGVVLGAGWTDVHIRLPAFITMAAVLILAGFLPLSPHFRRFMRSRVARWKVPLPDNLVATLGAWTAIGASWVILVIALPALVLGGGRTAARWGSSAIWLRSLGSGLPGRRDTRPDPLR